jgi:hypothetical protein
MENRMKTGEKIDQVIEAIYSPKKVRGPQFEVRSLKIRAPGFELRTPGFELFPKLCS